MVAALWSNSNWDDDKDSRKNAIDELDEKHQEALRLINSTESGLSVPSEEAEEVEIDKSNPFFAAVDRGMAKFDTKFSHVSKVDDKRDEYLKGLDQS